MSDLSYECKSLADQYYTYLNVGNFTAAQKLLTDNPTLNTMIINASKINYYTDMAMSLERFFKNDVENYLETRFAYKGAYDAATTYMKGNVVDKDGEGFLCRVDSSIGVSPTAHITTTNWAIVAKQGAQGASGIGLAPRGDWNDKDTYYVNDFVADSNCFWQCVKGNTNSKPSQENLNWIKLANVGVQDDYIIADDIGAEVGTEAIVADRLRIAHKIGNTTFDGTQDLSLSDIGASTSFKATGTLTTSGWTGSAAPYTQDLTVSGLLETDRPWVKPVLGTDDAARSLINTAWQTAATSSKPPYAYDGKITFYAASKPTTNIPVVVSVVRP